jgi:hypothetical protein
VVNVCTKWRMFCFVSVPRGRAWMKCLASGLMVRLTELSLAESEPSTGNRVCSLLCDTWSHMATSANPHQTLILSGIVHYIIQLDRFSIRYNISEHYRPCLGVYPRGSAIMSGVRRKQTPRHTSSPASNIPRRHPYRRPSHRSPAC